jgi:hypothetical protein
MLERLLFGAVVVCGLCVVVVSTRKGKIEWRGLEVAGELKVEYGW